MKISPIRPKPDPSFPYTQMIFSIPKLFCKKSGKVRDFQKDFSLFYNVY